MEKLVYYISHPEKLDRDTLYELRMLVRKFPYFDVARLLMLKNLYLLHDIEFGKEMRVAALYLKNRLPLFNLISGYDDAVVEELMQDDVTVDRTISLIDAFLDKLPAETLSLEAEGAAAVDYVSAYLKKDVKDEASVPALRGQDIIDEFLANGSERITLDLTAGTEEVSNVASDVVEEPVPENSFFTETLANIYIKQGKYEKALEIIKRLCLEYPNKNRYFADQIRFLEKIIKYTKRK